jgi:toxin ParE1/3/4
VKLEFSPAAQSDLMDIAMFIAHDNPKRALTFVEELESKCEALTRAPGIGTLRAELGEGIRVLPHGRYLIFYRDAKNDLRVERILHGSRDIGGGEFEMRGSIDS